MGVFQNNLLAGAVAATAGGGAFYSHQIENSCRFDASASSRLYKTFGTPTSTTQITVSFWIKIPSIAGYQQIFSKDNGYAGGGASFSLEDNYDGTNRNNLLMYGMVGNSGGNAGASYVPASQLVDPASWYHIHWKVDTGASGSGNSAKAVNHINGNIQTFTYTNEPSGNFNRFNDATAHSIGNGSAGTQGDSYLAEFVFLDGQYEDYTSFGELKNGVWVPKDPSSLTFGNNGFYLKFENSSDLGNDSSGNNNDFTATGLAADHQTIDTPTNGAGS